jgi:hypothetical protein
MILTIEIFTNYKLKNLMLKKEMNILNLILSKKNSYLSAKKLNRYERKSTTMGK